MFSFCQQLPAGAVEVPCRFVSQDRGWLHRGILSEIPSGWQAIPEADASAARRHADPPEDSGSAAVRTAGSDPVRRWNHVRPKPDTRSQTDRQGHKRIPPWGRRASLQGTPKGSNPNARPLESECSRHYGLSFAFSASLTAWRTASPKRELSSARPPQPEIASSASSTSSDEMSFDRTCMALSKNM